MMDILKEQVVVVFGATGRVGADVCRVLADNGAKIAVHYHSNKRAADNIVAEIERNGGTAYALQADVTDPESIQACYERVIQHFGRIDGVINHVHKGKEFTPIPIAEMEWSDWDDHIESIKAHFYICKYAIPHMRKQNYGRIIFISGGLSFRFFAGCSPFSTAKAGLNAFSKTLALEEGKHNITVNVIAPGKVVRPGDNLTDVSGEWEEMERKQIESIPLGRFCTPSDVANAALLLLMPSSNYITGQTVFLAGGEIMPMP